MVMTTTKTAPKKPINEPKTNGRDPRGRFAPGGPGGPGRPRRQVETDYLRALADSVSLEDWQEIVAAAVEAAKRGDARSREWLARYLLGEELTPLSRLAAWEDEDFDPIESERVTTRRQKNSEVMLDILGRY
jgi:hypothetical protein